MKFWLFKNPSGHWDFGRLGGIFSLLSYTAAFGYALIHLKAVPNWTDLGGGYALVMGGAGALIAGKDLAVAKANSITANSSTPQGDNS